MRISDWSSDVCSSDLDGLGGELVVHSSLKGKGVVRHIGCAAARINRSGSTAADVAGDIGVERQQRVGRRGIDLGRPRSEEHTSELQSLMRISYAVFCLTKKNKYEMH